MKKCFNYSFIHLSYYCIHECNHLKDRNINKMSCDFKEDHKMKFFCLFPVCLLGWWLLVVREGIGIQGREHRENIKPSNTFLDIRACSNCWGLCLSWMMTISEHPANAQALLLHYRKYWGGKNYFIKD